KPGCWPTRRPGAFPCRNSCAISSSSITNRRKTGRLPSPAWPIGRHLLVQANCGRILAWTVEYDPRVEKDLRKLDRSIQLEMLDYMDSRIATDHDHKRFGKALRRSK